MALRELAMVALSTALIGGSAIGLAAAATTEPAMPPAAGSDPATPTAPGAPPPTLPGETTPAAPASVAPARTAADVDAELTRNFGEAASFKTFLSDLQKAVADEDEKTVAKMVAYPFKTKVKGEEKTFAKEADFVKVYDDVVAANIVQAIRAQKYEALTVTPAGVGIGSGQVWFAKSGTGDDAAVKIIAINQNAGA